MLIAALLAMSVGFPSDASAEPSRRTLTFTSPSRFEGEVGWSVFPGINAVDHWKWGLHFSAMAFEDLWFSPWITLDTASRAFSPINPGAGLGAPRGTEPAETHISGNPLMLRLLARLPIRTETRSFRLFGGLTWYAFDLDHSMATTLPNAPTLGAIWFFPLDLNWQLEAHASLAVNPLGTFAFLVLSEGVVRFVPHRYLGLRAIVRMATVRSIWEGGTYLIQPSFSLGAMLRI